MFPQLNCFAKDIKCLKDMTEKAKVRVMMIHGVPTEGNKEKANSKKRVSSQELF